MPAADRTLRRLVADLAERDDEDVEAVLALLAPNQRRQFRDLLDTSRGRAPAADGKPPMPDWVTDRLDGAVAAGMTPQAREAFASCVAGWTPDPVSGGRGPSLIGRLNAFFSARGPLR